jgi:hypothetical protein
MNLIRLLPLLLLPALAVAQDSKPQEVIIKVQNQQSQPASQSVTEKAHEWVEFGEHVGGAIDAGLGKLTEHANKFAETDAGRFTMLVIAWKVAGQDAIILVDRFVGVVVGVPLMAVWICIYIWYLRKINKDQKILIKKSGFWLWGTREFQLIKCPYDNEDRFVSSLVATIVFFVVSIILIPNTII